MPDSLLKNHRCPRSACKEGLIWSDETTVRQEVRARSSLVTIECRDLKVLQKLLRYRKKGKRPRIYPMNSLKITTSQKLIHIKSTLRSLKNQSNQPHLRNQFWPKACVLHWRRSLQTYRYQITWSSRPTSIKAGSSLASALSTTQGEKKPSTESFVIFPAVSR